jgi:hypothetical protein
VPRIYPIDIERAFDRRWRCRLRGRVTPLAENDKEPATGGVQFAAAQLRLRAQYEYQPDG